MIERERNGPPRSNNSSTNRPPLAKIACQELTDSIMQENMEIRQDNPRGNWYMLDLDEITADCPDEWKKGSRE